MPTIRDILIKMGATPDQPEVAPSKEEQLAIESAMRQSNPRAYKSSSPTEFDKQEMDKQRAMSRAMRDYNR